jgi:hypothetical protein
MSSYPTISDIEMRWRASGRGVCVIVEGQTEQDDAWFYGRWFGDRAREITFFPQNGWQHVIDAVAELRLRLGSKTVYGIIDRDFETAVGTEPFPHSGVLRTPKYTLENYLLEAECWFKCIQPYTLRAAKPGWQTPAEVQTTLHDLHRQCISLSAFNWTLKQARSADPVGFATLPDKEGEYLEHPKALPGLGDVSDYLRHLSARLRLAVDLGQVYEERLAYLQSLSHDQLEEAVSGKFVHKLLFEQFPLKLSGQRSRDDMLSAYLFHCPHPPADLQRLVAAILDDAHS